MKYILILILVLLLAGAGYYFFSPALKLKHKTEAALKSFSQTVDTQDRARIGAALTQFLTDDAHVHLEVHLFSLAGTDDQKPLVEDFDKASFISFIDNLLYPLTAYAYWPQLESFSVSADRKNAAVTISSKQWADGVSYYAGSGMHMRFSSEASCQGQVAFDAGLPRLQAISCVMQLSSVPKPEDVHKLGNPDVLKQLLR